ncbi:MAG: type I methionyl aminopeptidase [Planctomycetota bacterium]|nr:type I methionyl aminopeptidase [Planctomycetota bacterium]
MIYYSERQIEKIRESGRIVGECLQLTREMVAPGVTTRQIEKAIAEHIKKRGGTSPFFGYELPGKVPFPCHICASVNEVVVHGLSDDEPLKEGDLVAIDCGVRKEGYIGDSAWTFPVGKVDETAQRLLKCGEEALYAGIHAAKPRGTIADISKAVQKVVEAEKFAVVRDYVGHGVGLSLHEEPQVPNYYSAGQSLPFLRQTLKAGMVFCIEPMVNEGTEKVTSVNGAWPVKTADGGRSVHFEHTVAIFQDRLEILTKQ